VGHEPGRRWNARRQAGAKNDVVEPALQELEPLLDPRYKLQVILNCIRN
jgi:hypothetical protein